MKKSDPTATVVPPAPLVSREPLPRRLADALRTRLHQREWQPQQRLPTEGELASQYGVSRSTVRAALSRLESEGLVRTQHGLGSFVTEFSSIIKAGLQDLRSVSSIISEQGHTPRNDYHARRLRLATAEESERLNLPSGAQVVSIERAISSDDELVAFEYTSFRTDLFPGGADPKNYTGSLFALLERHGVKPDRAVASVHAVVSAEIGWGKHRPAQGLYLLLDQTHYLKSQPIIHSRTYFIEGRFEFTIVRRG